MCTAISVNAPEHYFGRNLDLNCSYGEQICVMPRKFPIKLRCGDVIKSHYAIIGMAAVINGEPLYYDGANEYGLAVAGLNFPDNAHYFPPCDNKRSITPFELIPFILASCKTVNDAKAMLEGTSIVNISFSDSLPLSPLHWIISDKAQSLVIETMADGMHIIENPVGVLTNSPPLPYQLFNLNNYRNLTVTNGGGELADKLKLESYCLGLGAIGLPGDVSSMSRFVRAVFGKENFVCEGNEPSAVGQFFHLLSSVEMQRGICKTSAMEFDITVYSCCINTSRGLYYYTTYDNRQISCVDIYKTDLNSSEIHCFALRKTQEIFYQN